MPISVEKEGLKYHIKILSGSSWSQDLSKVKKLKGTKWKGEKKVWEIPYTSFSSIFSLWEGGEIILKGGIENPQPFINRENIDQLSSVVGEIKFTCPPMSYQEEYVRISPLKRRLIAAIETGMGKTRNVPLAELLEFLNAKKS